KSLLIILSFVAIYCKGQNSWPRSYYDQYPWTLNEIIQDYDGGYLGLVRFYYSGNSVLIKFDANGRLLWKKAIFFPSSNNVYATRFVRDNKTDLYITGYFFDTIANTTRAFVLKLDKCFNTVNSKIYADSISSW